MQVKEIRIVERTDSTEMSGSVGGERLWFRMQGPWKFSARGDAFLAAALLPAMSRGENLEIPGDAPVSPQLLEGVEFLQDVFLQWMPNLKRTMVHATTEPSRSVNAGVASFFSGGADGMFTCLKHLEEITHLLFVRGIDMQLDNDALFAEVVEANRQFAKAHQKTLLVLTSNVRFVGRAFGIGWTMYQGGGLAALALAVGLPRCYIAATHRYPEAFPWGSHPMTDPQWSTEGVELIHDGAEASRSDKLKRIVESPEAAKLLRVCWMDKGYNCGRCEKCLRTRICLRALKLSCPSLPPLDDLSELRGFRIDGESELTYVLDNLALLENSEDRALAKSLRRALLAYRLRRAGSEFDQLALGGRLRRWLTS